MSNTIIRAPWPGVKTTMLLPTAQWLDSQKPEADFQIKRTRMGRVITHPRTSTRRELRLRWRLTRQKYLELEAFANSYQAATWWLQLYDLSTWSATLVDAPIASVAIGRQTASRADTGTEAVDVTLTFSATKLT